MVEILIQLFMLSFMKVSDLYTTDYWSHNLSDGTTFQERVLDQAEDGYLTNYSEIIYHGECSLETATQMWKESPTHNEIMQNTDNKYMVLIMIPDKTGEKCYAEAVYREY